MTWAISAFVIVALASVVATRLLIGILRKRAILDHPNERSNHAIPTPRGGGLAVVPIALVAWATDARGLDGGLLVVLGGAWALAVLSWIDDLKSLPELLRLAVQAMVVAIAAHWLSAQGPVFQGLLPPWLDTVAAALIWLWFVNLFNFMDGIDGLAGVETISVCVGLAVLGAFAADGAPLVWFAVTLAGATAGFLVWNWHPARIFLGDVGSIPLGFMLGFLILSLAARGYWAAALILPSYYLADATITLMRRILRGEKFWRAHSQHFYQQAVRGGRSHAKVGAAVIAANLVLIALAIVALSAPLPALAGAVLTVAALLAWMRA